MKKLFLIIPVVAIILSGCAPSSYENVQDKLKAEVALENFGYTEIILGSNVIFGCSDDDSPFNSYKFTAKDKDKDVEGVVCCGLILKGCTIRY